MVEREWGRANGAVKAVEGPCRCLDPPIQQALDLDQPPLGAAGLKTNGE
jgi:hypothetical protein